MAERPSCIVHFSEIRDPDEVHYPDDDEPMSIGSPFAKKLGLGRLGIHHEHLPPGRRTSWPHAESDEDEFVYVLEGTPDAWIDGHVHRIGPGDGVGFPAGTGVCHTFINNTAADVRLLVVGEANKKGNRVYYPLHPEHMTRIAHAWDDPPRRPQGPHDGVPDARRAPKG